MPRILTTGGCGYIGSHTIVDLLQHGFEVVSIDDLSRSSERSLDGIEAITGVRVENIQVDLADREQTLSVIDKLGHVDGIIHFAAYKSVNESVDKPELYYRNNLNSLLNLLELIDQMPNDPALVFSSSCSVYGNISELPVTETTPLGFAESPYAYTKQVGERILTDKVVSGSNVSVVLLRYFNPAGAHTSAEIGEFQTEKPENLVPYITQTAIGKRPMLSVFGNDYDTRDGTCIRDYIHVVDIAHAHTLALQKLLAGKLPQNPEILNLGTGNGVSVQEVIDAFEQTNGVKLNYQFAPRRPGDVVAVYADNTKAKQVLGWEPQYSLNDMMSTAWQWEQKLSTLA